MKEKWNLGIRHDNALLVGGEIDCLSVSSHGMFGTILKVMGKATTYDAGIPLSSCWSLGYSSSDPAA